MLTPCACDHTAIWNPEQKNCLSPCFLYCYVVAKTTWLCAQLLRCTLSLQYCRYISRLAWRIVHKPSALSVRKHFLQVWNVAINSFPFTVLIGPLACWALTVLILELFVLQRSFLSWVSNLDCTISSVRVAQQWLCHPVSTWDCQRQLLGPVADH